MLRRTDLEEAISLIGLSESDAADVRERLLFCRWALSASDSDHYILPDCQSGGPKLLLDFVSPSERSELAARYANGDRLAFRLPVLVRPKKSEEQKSHVSIYIQYDPNLKKSNDEYVREGITISSLTGQSGHRGLRAILIADDAPVARLLRDSENIAHTEWRERNAERVSNGYEYGPTTVGYIKSSVRKIVSWLTTVNEEVDRLALADLFPAPEAGPLASGGKGRKGMKPEEKSASTDSKATADSEGEQDDSDSEDDFPTNEPAVIRERLDDGFRVRSNPKRDVSVKEVRVSAVIPTIRSKSFAKHSPADFSFTDQPGMVRLAGVEEVRRSHNRLVVRPTAERWFVEIRGFDPRRPLRYDARATTDTKADLPQVSSDPELQET